MDSGQLVWIIVGIVVVLAIVAVAVNISRKRKTEADRHRAAEMREKAEADQLAAKEHEAKAARAEADAKAAEVEAERLRQQARGTQQEAASVRANAEEQLRKADDVDPDVARSGRGEATTGEVRHDERPGNHHSGSDTVYEPAPEGEYGELRRDRSHRAPADEGTAEGTAEARDQASAERRDADEPHGGRPRNL